MRPASATTGLAPPTVQSATLPRPQRGTRLRAGAAPRERGGKTRIAFGASRNPQPGRPQSGSSSSGAGSAPFLPFLQTLPSFAQILNLLGETGFGDGRADGPRSPLGSFYRWLLRLGSKVAQPRGAASSSGSDLELAALSAQQRERIADLCAVLACSQGAALRLAAKHPQALDLPSADIVARVLGLKRLLPGCDIVFLISNQPALYFQGTPEAMLAIVNDSVTKLQEGLRGANVFAVVDQDPALLFIDVASGIARMRELWDVDEDALAASSPFHLALAVRALSSSGAPLKF